MARRVFPRSAWLTCAALVASGCGGCAPTPQAPSGPSPAPTLTPPPVVPPAPTASTEPPAPPAAPAPAPPPAPSFGWYVIDPDRLVEPGGTEALFSRFVAYYEAAGSQDEDPRVKTPPWQERTHDYAPSYLPVSTWSVQLWGDMPGTCSWTVGTKSTDDPCAGPKPIRVTGPTKVSVKAPDGQEASFVVNPRDVLIASIGDSYASGEGVPDERKAGRAAAQWVSKRCHRSLYSAPALAGLFYTRINPHVSVTHLSFACSGALFTHFLNHGYMGIAPDGAVLDGQLDDVLHALTNAHRTADFLTISGGGNDVGFGPIVKAAALEKPKTLRYLYNQVEPKMEQVVAVARALRTKLDKLDISKERVLVTEYPNPTSYLRAPSNERDETPKNVCGYRGRGIGQFTPGLFSYIRTIKAGEIADMDRYVRSRLSVLTDSIVGALVATRVVGIDADFGTHGFCAPELGPNAASRWINNVTDSDHVEGNMDGAMHPNVQGEAAIARHILENMVSAECSAGVIAADDSEWTKLCSGNAWQEVIPGYSP